MTDHDMRPFCTQIRSRSKASSPNPFGVAYTGGGWCGELGVGESAKLLAGVGTDL